MGNKLTGKVAIITGGARGMGAATSRMFVAAGAKVAIADMLETEGTALAAELGENAGFWKHDVTSEDSWANLVAEVEAAFGGVDVLVNNAGIIIFKDLMNTTLEDYKRVLDVNLVGDFLGIKAVAPGMVARRKGSIVNISSIDGLKGSNCLGAYSSSKWGVRGLTKVAAMELGHKGVRVNSVHPGGIDTIMSNHSGVSREEINANYAGVPLQRIGAPEEVAAASLFLASDDSSYIHGTEIVVDGGWVTGSYHAGFPGSPGFE